MKNSVFFQGLCEQTVVIRDSFAFCEDIFCFVNKIIYEKALHQQRDWLPN